MSEGDVGPNPTIKRAGWHSLFIMKNCLKYVIIHCRLPEINVLCYIVTLTTEFRQLPPPRPRPRHLRNLVKILWRSFGEMRCWTDKGDPSDGGVLSTRFDDFMTILTKSQA